MCDLTPVGSGIPGLVSITLEIFEIALKEWLVER